MAFSGSCHCKNLRIHLETLRAPEAFAVRRCTCTFCVRHQPRYISDPQGSIEIRVHDQTLLGRYRFGLALADFLFCRQCGVFMAALEPGTPARAVININTLEEASKFTAEPVSMDFDGEDETARRDRRARTWTPARLVFTDEG